MNNSMENENLLKENIRRNEKAIEEIRKARRYDWACPFPNRNGNCFGCPYYKMSHPIDRCLNREKWIQLKEGMELTDKQKEELGLNYNTEIEGNHLPKIRTEVSGKVEEQSINSDMSVRSPSISQNSPFSDDNPINEGNPNENKDKKNKKFDKNQILFLILIGLLAVGIILFSYFTTGGYFHSNLNSTLVDNSSCIMPDIPACPANTCNCPAPNLTLSIPESFLGLLNQNSINNTNSS